VTKTTAQLIIALVFLITVWALMQLAKLQFDYDFENFFPNGEPELEFYLQFREQFENDNDYLQVGLNSQRGIFNADFLSNVAQFTNKAAELPFVESVISLTNLKEPVAGPLGISMIQVLRWDNPERLMADSIRLMNSSSPPAFFVGTDGKSTAVMIRNKQMIAKEEGDILSHSLDSLLQTFDFESYHIAGKAYAQGVFVESMQSNLAIFLSISLAFVILFLWLTYREFWGIWAPLLVVVLAVIWLLGLIAFTGKKLDILSIIIPNIMLVIGMSDVVHLLSRYLEELRKGVEKLQALKVAYLEVGRATFLTSITTAIGFASLGLSAIKPIRELGLYTAAGVAIAFILAFSLLPALLFLLPKPKIAEQQPHYSWKKSFQKVFIFTIRKRLYISIASVLVLAFCAFFIPRLEVSTYLIDDIPADSKLKQSFNFFDEYYGGSKPFEMAIHLKGDRNVFDREVLHQLEKLEAYLSAEFGVSSIYSPLQVAKSLNKALSGGLNASYRLPETEEEWGRFDRNLRRFTAGKQPIPIFSEDASRGRISGRMGDIGSALAMAKTEELQLWIEENLDKSVLEMRITGTSFLIDLNNELIAKSTLQGFALAMLAIALVSALLFRSWRMSVMAILPNLMPVLMIAAFMAWVGISVKLSTAIIFAICFGIVVDDSIHFLSKLLIELQKGRKFLFALRRTYLSGGKAIIITSLILSAGFFALIFSSFSGVKFIGLLVVMTLLFAVVLDLTLLPALLSYLGKRLELRSKDTSTGK
jgi:predicted RND superfamily exporter protein